MGECERASPLLQGEGREDKPSLAAGGGGPVGAIVEAVENLPPFVENFSSAFLPLVISIARLSPFVKRQFVSFSSFFRGEAPRRAGESRAALTKAETNSKGSEQIRKNRNAVSV